jgi:hypothetical protein
MPTEATTDTFQNAFHLSIRERIVELTRKNTQRYINVTNPSIRSKLLHKLRSKFTPKISAIATTPKNIRTAHNTGVFLGTKERSYSINTHHSATAIPTKKRNANAFPVINGKYIVLVTTNGIKGTRNSTPRIPRLRIEFMENSIQH